ncbi:hypothetical protein LMH78_01355 [Vibrio lentus]|uniref:hypothetical protein n=1 Tax=Vibrio lentus TaxID=136468 RepID=UPI001E4577B2|nr:hypothetical protein [Vibrio lentus]MCC4854438.1 hypothetical protein [Vibrio lentus]
MLKTIPLLLVCLISLPVLATEASNEQAVAPVPAQQASTNYEKALKDTEELKKRLQEAQTNNEQLQRANTTLKQENNALKQNLQTQVDVMAGNLKALEERTANTPTNKSFDILATSFYERLRSTDDSVSFWGIVSGLIALLITVILASLALFHFGKIRDIENKATSVLAQSQRETRMAVNEAIRTAKKSATDIAHDWVQEEGAKEIKTFVQDLNKQLDEVQVAISKVRSNEKIADEVTKSIRNHEKSIAQSLPSSESNSTVNIDFLPTELQKHQYDLVQASCGIEPVQQTIRLINDILSKSIGENKDILTFKVFCYTLEGQYKKAISFYEKHLFSYYEDKHVSYLNKVPVLASLVSCHYYSKNYVTTYQETKKALSSLIAHNSYVFRAHQLAHFNLLAQLELKTLTSESLKTYQDLLALEGQDFDENSKEIVQRVIFIAEMNLKPESINSKNIHGFVCSAHSLAACLKRAIAISHELGRLGKSKESLELTSHIRQVLLRRQKRAHFIDYLILTLNHANGLYKCGHLRPARRLAKFIDKKVNQEKLFHLDPAGHREINEILGRKQ